MQQKLHSFQEPPSHDSYSAPIFSFGAGTEPKHVSSLCLSTACVAGIRSFVGSTIPLGSVRCRKGDGRDGWLEQARVGNFPKGKNHSGLPEHAGTNKSKSYHDLGLVRFGREASMATHLPSISRKQKEGMASSV